MTNVVVKMRRTTVIPEQEPCDCATAGGCDVTGAAWVMQPQFQLLGSDGIFGFPPVFCPDPDAPGVSTAGNDERYIQVNYPDPALSDLPVVLYAMPVGPDVTGVTWTYSWSATPTRGETVTEVGFALRIDIPLSTGGEDYRWLSVAASCNGATVGQLWLLITDPTG